jgi:hypothetical protein
MRTVQVYIEGQRLDLFDDEQISVTSKQQDVSDISKIFTDFSQSFSVPSTPNNDAIFSHFYNSDVGDLQDVSTIFDANQRRDAFIEIDLTTFRRGKIQLEKAEIKDNQAYSYQVTFYGDITSLKDKFNDDKLVNLTYLRTYGHAYTSTEIENRITDGSANYVLRYPLITRRYLTYDDGGTNDINTNTGAIQYSELFPAVKIIGIIAAIEIQYGVDFQGTFLSDKRFQNCFLFCQNKDDFQFFTSTEDVDFTSGGETLSYPSGDVYTNYFDLTNDTLTITPINFETAFNVTPSSQFWQDKIKHKVLLNIFCASTTAEYYVDVFLNDVLTTTLDGNFGINQQVYLKSNDFINTQDVLSFRVRATESTTVTVTARYEQEGTNFFSGSIQIYTNSFYASSSNTLTGNIDPIAYLPDMKVSDFFTAILKEFNLTCYPLEQDVFQVEPLDDWYSKGAIVDITKYTDIKSINVERLKLFNNIVLKYEQSENILNNQFRELFGREYGDAQIAFDYDGGEYKIEQPFENMQMNRFTGTDLQVGFTVDKDLNTYTPKPMLLYMYDETNVSFKFYNGTSYSTLTEYMPFGQDVKVNTENYSLNFNAEISTLTGQVEQNTLFATYYFGYLSNLFKLKNRRYTVKTNLPVSLLTNLRLNDRLIIRDKRYIIESMKSNLNNGDVDFVLLNDFRAVISDSGTEQPETVLPDENAQDVEVRILFPNDAASATVSTTTSGVTISPSTLTSEGIVTVSIPDNPNATTVLKTENDVDYINTENTNRIRTEGGTVELITLTVIYTYINGTQTTSEIYIQQQP